MPALLVRRKAQDDARCHSIVAGYGPVRLANGSQGRRLVRNAADTNEALTLLIRDGGDRARLFIRTDDLQDRLPHGGVSDRPDLWVLDEIGLATA